MSRAKLRRFFRHGLLPQLIVFEAVSRLQSVTRAAEELHLAQPTVSLQLKKLAETLEVQLFEQRGSQLYLTAAGKALLETCDEIMSCLTRAEERLAAWRLPRAETIHIAAEPQACQVASKLLAEFCAKHPGVQGSLHIADRTELLSRFGKFEDDVYLFELQLDDARDGRRWTVTHAKSGRLVNSAAKFFRQGLQAE